MKKYYLTMPVTSKIPKNLLILFIVIATIVASLLVVRTIRNKDYTHKHFAESYPYAAVENLWVSYKRQNIQSDGRTIDVSQNSITTSEGQSYSLLRAVWMDDKQVFDKVLEWTQNNLQKRPGDNLFAWRWGQKDDGSWGILTANGGMNSATDADQDIALALILANKRWNQQYYIDEAKGILKDIWDKEVVSINGRPYLTAGDWAVKESQPTVNPSYFNFAAYDIFAQVDPAHDWGALKSTSYEVLNQSTNKLPPDWVSLDRSNASVIQVTLPGKNNNFSDDAIRIPWRVGLDWKWNADKRAYSYLTRLSFLEDQWQKNKAIFRTYTTDGQIIERSENLSTYGAILPYFEIINPSMGKEIYNQKIASDYNPDTFNFSQNDGYYDKNWGWFGMAFYSNNVVNSYQAGKGTL